MTIISNSIVLDFTTIGKDVYKDNKALDGSIALRIPEQAYFWSGKWQAAEAEATTDIKKGRVKRFPNARDAIKYLRSQKN
jgi:hypothetical protein